MIERRHQRARRLLRSVLIASAGAAVWMALSATAANADSGNNSQGSLLGGVKSTVASASQGHIRGDSLQRGGADSNGLRHVVASSVPVPVIPVSLPQPVPQSAVPQVSLPRIPVPQNLVPQNLVPQNPVPEKLVPQVVEVLDDAVKVVPLVESVAPGNPASGAVSVVAESLTSTIDDVAAVLPRPPADTLQPVTDTAGAAVTEMLQPVTETLVDVLNLAQLPGPGQLVDFLDPAPPADQATLGNRVQGPQSSVPFIDVFGGIAVLQSALAVTGAAGLYLGARMLAPSPAPQGPGGPSPVPAMPSVYGAGSGHAAGDGFSASAAGVHSIYDFSVRPWVALGFPAGEQHPSPVSFDPGSSPD